MAETTFNYPANAKELPKRRTPIAVPAGMTLTDAGTLQYNKPQTTPNIPE